MWRGEEMHGVVRKPPGAWREIEYEVQGSGAGFLGARRARCGAVRGAGRCERGRRWCRRCGVVRGGRGAKTAPTAGCERVEGSDVFGGTMLTQWHMMGN